MDIVKIAMAALAGIGIAAAAPALAQEYPAKPINIYVGYSPGDNMDVMTRVLGQKLEKILGQPITILNKPGGAGSVALSLLAKDKPDGYTLAAVIETPLDRIPLLRKLDYKPDDFAPVLQFASGVTGVVVSSKAPWKTFQELLDYAKKNPASFTYATSGAGSTMHVAMQYIGVERGLDWTHVPYPGARDTLTAVLGGHINAAVGSTQWANDVRQGNLKLLAIVGNERMASFPDVPTTKELGFNFSASSASVIVARAGTPQPIIDKLDKAFRTAMDDPEFVKTVKNLELDVLYRDNQKLKTYLADTMTQFKAVIEELKLPTEFNTGK